MTRKNICVYPLLATAVFQAISTMRYILVLYILFGVGFCITCVGGQTVTFQGFSLTAFLGDSLELSCNVTGVTSLQGLVFFKRGSANLCTVNSKDCSQFSNTDGYSCGCVSRGSSMDKTFYINISSVSLQDDSDNWMCQYNGFNSGSVGVEVYYTPEITSLPIRQNVTEHTGPNIDCSSYTTPGNPSLTSYRWTGPDDYNKTGAVLDRNVSRSDGGYYNCTATNTVGLSDTSSVIINVQYAPSLQITRNKDITENTSPKIDCSVGITPGNPVDVSFAWTGPDGYNKTGAVLNRNITRSQGGRYICTATNTVGLSDTAEVNINVLFLDAPSLNVSSYVVMENDSVQVVCNVASNPTVQMTIRNVDNKTNIVEQVLTNSLQYNIDRVQCLHNGTFKCVADNKELPRIESDSEEISVLCSPRHDYRQPLKQIFFRAISAAATMTVDVIANPLPTFTWWRYVDGQLEPISDTTVHKIRITDLQSTLQVTVAHVRDYGKYAVKMENEFGENILSYTLSPVTVPLAPGEVRVVNISSSALVLQWKSNINGGSEQTFSVDYRTEDSDWVSWRTGIPDPGTGVLVKLKVTGLKQNTKYLFQVYATNIYGSSIKVTKEGSTTDEIAEANYKLGVLLLQIGIGVGSVAIVLMTVVVCVILFKVCRRKEDRSADKSGVGTVVPERPISNGETDSQESEKYKQSMQAGENDKQNNCSIEREGYDGTSVREPCVDDDQYVHMSIEQTDAAKDVANSAEEIQDQHTGTCSSNQSDYLTVLSEPKDSPESKKYKQSMQVGENDKQNNCSIETEGYDGTSVRKPRVEDAQYVDMSIEQTDAAKDVANSAEETQYQYKETCYSNQPDYLNVPGEPKDNHSRKTDVKLTDTKPVADEYENGDTGMYEPVETK